VCFFFLLPLTRSSNAMLIHRWTTLHRRPILPSRPPRLQNRLCGARCRNGAQTGRKGPRERGFCGGGPDRLSHPDRLWLFRRALVARGSAAASLDLGLLAASYVHVPCGRYLVEFSSASDNDRLLHIPSSVPEFGRDGKVRLIC
jgi:hypothetical protein